MSINSEYKKYEAKVKKIRGMNQIHLTEFGAWLREKGLTEKTIKNHITNVDFYINHFLVRDDALKATEGCSELVGSFLGYHFIRKAMWASCAQIKANAASFKKFYAFMVEKGEVKQEKYNEFLAIIKEEMPEWLETMKMLEEEEAKSHEEAMAEIEAIIANYETKNRLLKRGKRN